MIKTGMSPSVSKAMPAILLAAVIGLLVSGVSQAENPDASLRAGSGDAGSPPWGFEAPYWPELEPGVGVTEVHGVLALGEARTLEVDYVGLDAPEIAPEARAEPREIRPRALALDDYDEDGVPDLVVAQAAPGGGRLVLYRGNAATLFPRSAPAERMRALGTFTRAPFLSPARVFDSALSPDFLGTGDFDNDGHRDVVVGAWGSRHLSTWLGDGQGRLAPGPGIPLAGGLTAATVGEVHRRDGIADLAVAVDGGDGAQLVVFHGPEGVLNAVPEVQPLPHPAAAIVMERLDDDLLTDLAVAAGSELIVLKGRDRTQSRRAAAGADAEPAVLSLPFEILAMASGNFLDEAGYRPELALLASDGAAYALSRSSFADLVPGAVGIVASESLHVIAAAGAGATGLVKVRASNTTTDDLLLVGDSGQAAELLVTGPGTSSPRDPLAEAGTGMAYRHLLPQSSGTVAAITARLSVDAYDDLVMLQAGQSDPTVQLLAAPLGGGGSFLVNDLSMFGSGPLDGICDIDAMTMGDQCNLNEALAEAASFTTGTVTIEFAGDGPYQSPGQNSITVPLTIDGGAGGGDPNVQIILNSTLGLDAAPSVIRGVRIIGTLLVFRENGGNNLFENNWVGLDASGTAVINVNAGLNITTNNAQTTFGGASPGAGNVIAARSIVNSFSDGDVFRGNKIGTGKNGTLSLGTQPGTVLDIDGPSALVGGTAAADGNLISGNQFAVGVAITGSGVLVQGNLIGTDLSGTTALGNGAAGVTVGTPADMVTIGGTAIGAGNVISANSFPSNFYGLSIATTGTVTVQGNIIGGDITGTVGLGNRGVGISLQSGGHTIGGTTASAANTIVDSQAVAGDPRFVGNGIEIPLAAASNNLIQGNRIGVGLLLTPLGNQGHGIIITSSAADNEIGGTDAGAGNEIRYNDGTGVLVSGNAGPGNRILGNEIASNGGLGIDLSVVSGPDGPTANDPGDGDGGPNGLQNYPVIDMVDPVAGNLEGSLASMPNTTYRLEVFANAACDPSGFGEGGSFLSATEVITDGNGDADFILNQGGLNNPTLTATDAATGNTSEFSSCFPAEAPASVVNSVGDDPDNDIGDGDCDTGGMIDRGGMMEPECTLRAAFEEQLPQILFDIPPDQYPPTGAPLIQPASPYPIIDYPVTVDAGSQPGVGVVQVDFGQSGAAAAGGGGEAPGGLCPNPGVGLQIAATNVQLLPGMALFCFSDYGVWLSGSFSTLEGVKIGTDFDDTAGLGGEIGVLIRDDGQGQPGEDHNQVINSEIVGNTTGVKIEGAASQGNELTGNFLGIIAASLTELGNGTGVLVSDAGGNFIEDNTVVNSMLAGVVLEDSGDGTTTTGNRVRGNRIGTDSLGAPGLGNGTNGVWIHNARTNFIGGDLPSQRNVISGNGDFTPDSETGGGILVQGHNSRGNVIEGNYIGTTPDGLDYLGNAKYGIYFAAADTNTVGGAGAGQGNVISGNVGDGIHIFSNGIADGTSPDNPLGQLIQGNFIGTDRDGFNDVGNGKSGIFIKDSAGNSIGGLEFGDGGNLISGNDKHGVELSQNPLDNYFRNEITGNRIGTDVNDLFQFGLPNQMDGIFLGGFDTLVKRNRIAHNGGAGVVVADPGDGNQITRNSISANSALGIDLRGGDEDGFGVTANDPGDTLPGANRLVNFPVITSVETTPSMTGPIATIRGTYDHQAGTHGPIEVFTTPACDPSGHGEGEAYLARHFRRSNGKFTAFAGATGLGEVTATSSIREMDLPFAHTSEFSACFEALPPPGTYLVINELDSVPAGGEFIELSSGGDGGVSLTGKVLVLYDGADDESYAAFDLDGQFLDADGFFIAGNAAVPGAAVVFADGLLLDGPAAAALYEADGADFPAGTPVTTDNLVDAVVYGPAGAPDAGLLALLEPNQPQLDEAAAGNVAVDSLQRCPDSSGGARYTDTYGAWPPTPGDENACVTCYLEPEQVSSDEGEEVSLTVTVLVSAITPMAGIDVDFDVVSGPNSGEMASAMTDDFGEAVFAYTGLGGTGEDAVTASGMFGGVPFFCEAGVNWLVVPIFINGFE